MFLRPYKYQDKRQLQQLFFDTIHSVNARDFDESQLNWWAPPEPDRAIWSKLDQQWCTVVEQGKQIVGFSAISAFGTLDFLYVHRDFQHRGIATALIKQTERIAKKHHIGTIYTESPLSACGFFEKRGFVRLEESRKIFGEGMLLLCPLERKIVVNDECRMPNAE